MNTTKSVREHRARRPKWVPLVLGLLITGGLSACVQNTLAAPPAPTSPTSPSSTRAGETEEGGGGSTFPQRSLNDPYGLAASRANCAICHRVDPSEDAFQFNRFGQDWRRILFEKIAPGSDDIFDPTQAQRVAASVDAELVRLDSDGDGYSNGIELMFGSDPGDPASTSSRSVAELTRWYDRLGGVTGLERIRRDESDHAAVVAGPDSDNDGVADDLEEFAGFDPHDPDSVPLTSARRLAATRIALGLG